MPEFPNSNVGGKAMLAILSGIVVGVLIVLGAIWYLFVATYGKSQKVVSSSPPPIPDAVKFVRNPNEYLSQLKAWAESWISHSITLIAIFLFQTLAVPALLFWGLIGAARLILRLKPTESPASV